MAYESDGIAWAQKTFGHSDLGDPRRVERLVDVAARLSKDPTGSLSRICCGDKAAVEGAYKLIENRAVRPEAIAEGMHSSVCSEVANRKLCLAIQDTTDVELSYGLTKERREQGNPSGYLVHSTLMVDGLTREPFGLAAQSRWIRKAKKERPGKKTRSQRPIKEKESYKWFAAIEEMEKRLSSLSNVITVCDREADIYAFLQYHLDRGYRFVVRAAHNRKITSPANKLVEKVEQAPVMGQRMVQIAQRGKQWANNRQQGRKARKAREVLTTLQATRVQLIPPNSQSGEETKPIDINVVLVNEPNPPADTEGIRWLLLTTEPINTKEQIEQIVDHYSARWLVEDFHKVWKTGCNLEKRRLQTQENFERMMIIAAGVAARIMQLKALAQVDNKSCEGVLSTDEWHCLYAITGAGKTFPSEPPSAKWAYYALAKLAGWTDSKRTGRVGWQTLWTGWERLHLQLDGWHAAVQMNQIHRNKND